MDVKLIGFKPNGDRVEIPVDKPSVILGRGSECDICIPISSVSRQHCEVSVAGDQVWVSDLSSANGTFVNNDKIDEVRLTAGDRLVMGPLVLTLQVDGTPTDIEPASVASPALTEDALFGASDDDGALSLAEDEPDASVFALSDTDTGAEAVDDGVIALEPAELAADDLGDPFAAFGEEDDDSAEDLGDPFAELGIDADDGDDDDDPLNF
jgi:predicted component of type VI protein secretion system